MFTIDREALAWAAGFFDGEGSFAILTSHVQPRSPSMVATVSQKERTVLDRFHEAVGVGKVFGPYKRAASYQFAANTFERVQHVVCVLWPWLSTPKREQAVRTLRSWHSSPAQRRTTSIRGRS